MNDNNKKDGENSIGYILGTIVGATALTCLAVSIIAITVKFLTVLF